MKKILILLTIAFALASCSDDAKWIPGLWTDGDVIETFPGDTVHVKGQVSNYIGINSVVLSCEDWGVNKVINSSLLSASGPDAINNSYTDSPALSKKPIFNFMDDDNEAAAHSNDIEW